MMLVDDFKFRWRLDRLQKAKRRIEKYYRPKITTAREANEREEEQMHASEMLHELDMVDSDIRFLQHRYVTRHAELLLVPVPKFRMKPESWLKSEFDGRSRLTDDALDVLGQRVRQERRERIELFFLWPSALIGFVGGVIGIVSAVFF